MENEKALNIPLTPEELEKVLTVDFYKRELVLIFNILVSQKYALIDAQRIISIIQKIEPLVQPEKKEGIIVPDVKNETVN